jgi:glucose-1-phosphate thymidylyltransferase
MKAIVLAGGFAKRMWPLTKEKPKHLLDIAGRPMLEYVLDSVLSVPGLERVYISTNAKFQDHFEKFLGGYIGCPAHIELELVIEDTFSEGEKLGSVGALGYLIKNKNINEDLIVIGGDNLFDFNIEDVMDLYTAKSGNVMVVYDVKSNDLAKLYGIVTLDDSGKIVKFIEKPPEPESTLASTACYFFTPEGVKMITQYIEEGNKTDALGFFIEWLVSRTDVYGYVHKGSWFDIGSLESYDEANKFYRS